MKLVKKANLEFVDGRLVDTEGVVISPRRLVAEVNELVELKALVDFVKANASQLQASTEKVTFTLPKFEAPRLKTEKVAATPLLDEHRAADEARAREWVDVQNVKDIDGHLSRYTDLAKFFAREHVVVDGDTTDAQFLANPLNLTEEAVVEIVEEYHEPEIFRLSKLVHIVS